MPILTFLISMFIATTSFSDRSVEPTNERPPMNEDTPEYIIVDMNTP